MILKLFVHNKASDIRHQTTPAYTSQLNGVAERKNQTILDMARSLLKAKKLPKQYWAEAVSCAVYLLNRCPTTANDFEAFCTQQGIRHQTTPAYTPQLNGVAERKNQTILDMVRSLLKAKKLPKQYWAEAVLCAVYLLNRCPTRSLQVITPQEAWSGHKTSVTHLRVFGCVAYAKIPDARRTKLDDKSEK